MNPQDIIQQRYEGEKQRIQSEFSNEWGILQSRKADDAQFIKLHDKYRQMAYRLNAETQNAIYPKQESLRVKAGDIDYELNALDEGIKRFRILPGQEANRAVLPKNWNPLKGFGVGQKFGFFPEEAEVFDPVMVTFDEKGEPKRGAWRKAGLEEIQKLGELTRRRDLLQQQKDILFKSPDITNRLQKAAASSSKMGIGTIGSNMATEVEDRKPPEPKPAVKKLEDPLGLR